ncbi:MAG: site-2 protease family protein [Archaeoglobaceae archaeon]
MQWSFKIFTIADIEIRIHLTLLIILGLLIYILYWVNPFPVGFSDLDYSRSVKLALSVIAALGLFVAILLHELAHSILSKRSGGDVRGIMLFIFGGVSMMEDTLSDPDKEITMAFAGPFTSFVIAAGSFGLYLTGLPLLSEFFMVFGIFNFALGAFNLLPAFPLDGGRILRGFLAKKMSFVSATQSAASVGKAFAVMLGILGIFANPWLILIALFIYMGASEEEKMVVEKGTLSKRKIRDIMTEDPITVSPQITVNDFINIIFKNKHPGYPVVDGDKIVGLITLQDVSDVDKNSKIGDLVSDDDAITISPEDTAYRAFQLMNENNVGRLSVVEDGVLVGIISRTDLMRLRELEKITG